MAPHPSWLLGCFAAETKSRPPRSSFSNTPLSIPSQPLMSVDMVDIEVVDGIPDEALEFLAPRQTTATSQHSQPLAEAAAVRKAFAAAQQRASHAFFLSPILQEQNLDGFEEVPDSYSCGSLFVGRHDEQSPFRSQLEELARTGISQDEALPQILVWIKLGIFTPSALPALSEAQEQQQQEAPPAAQHPSQPPAIQQQVSSSAVPQQPSPQPAPPAAASTKQLAASASSGSSSTWRNHSLRRLNRTASVFPDSAHEMEEQAARLQPGTRKSAQRDTSVHDGPLPSYPNSHSMPQAKVELADSGAKQQQQQQLHRKRSWQACVCMKASAA